MTKDSYLALRLSSESVSSQVYREVPRLGSTPRTLLTSSYEDLVTASTLSHEHPHESVRVFKSLTVNLRRQRLSRYQQQRRLYTKRVCIGNQLSLRYAGRNKVYSRVKELLRQRKGSFKRPTKLINRGAFLTHKRPQVGVIRIRMTGNNTSILLRTFEGRTIRQWTSGSVAGCLRNGPAARTVMMYSLTSVMKRHKIRHVYVEKLGLGSAIHRLHGLLRTSRIHVHGWKTFTPTPHNGTRRKSPRRV